VFEDPELQPPMDSGTQTEPMPGSAPGVIESTANPADERALYESAFDSLKEGRYAEAARRFQTFLDQYPNGEYSPNAQYWLGESYYVTQNYQIALEAFQRLLSRFPASNKAPDALLKVGYCHYELRQWSQAESVLNQVVQQYPDTTVARLAQGRLRALRLENR
jgi:tol-pal system protein YbgF